MCVGVCVAVVKVSRIVDDAFTHQPRKKKVEEMHNRTGQYANISLNERLGSYRREWSVSDIIWGFNLNCFYFILINNK